MSRRYVLAPEATHDLVQIWHYIEKNATIEIADRIESDNFNELIIKPRTFTNDEDHRDNRKK